MTVNIHGRQYITVAERLTAAHMAEKKISITTEVLCHEPKIVIKATVTTAKGVFTGISAANPAKSIEKESPYEVAESSAVGRALAFAGYETTLGIASAEEMHKATLPQTEQKVAEIPQTEPETEAVETVYAPKYIETAAGKALSKAYYMLAKDMGIEAEKAHDLAVKNFKLTRYTDITKEQLLALTQGLKKKKEEKALKEAEKPIDIKLSDLDGGL